MAHFHRRPPSRRTVRRLLPAALLVAALSAAAHHCLLARNSAASGARGAAACALPPARVAVIVTPPPTVRRFLREAPGRRVALLQGASAALLPVAALDAGAPAAYALTKTADEKQAAQVFRDSTPSVIAVSRNYRPGEQKRRMPGQEDGGPPSVGSGFVWDATHVVTNFHVVKDLRPEEILVIFLDPNSGRGGEVPRRMVLPGILVGSDPATDTAVIRVVLPPNATSFLGSALRPLARGTSDDVEVGQTVYAIGNPFGLDHSMSRGIVSGVSRTLELGDRPIRGCIQTDASINPGNSGGPLLDSAGRVVGINTAILTGTGENAGVGLAIPVDTVSKNVELILKQGFVSRGFLGITFAPDMVSESLQLPGIVVFAVVPGSPAEKAGVRPMVKGALGDIVVGLDGEKINSGADLFRLLDKKAPGDDVLLGVQRSSRAADGMADVQRLTLNVTLSSSSKPPQESRAAP